MYMYSAISYLMMAGRELKSSSEKESIERLQNIRPSHLYVLIVTVQNLLEVNDEENNGCARVS